MLEASLIYALSPLGEEGFLGWFPLTWLGVSSFQWDLCALREYRYWCWLVLFLLAQAVILKWGHRLSKVARWSLATSLLPLWAAMISLFKVSFLLPLTFATAPARRFPDAAWARRGSVAAALTLFILFKGQNYLTPNWEDLFDLLVAQHYGAFFLLSWLGLTLVEPGAKGTFRHAVLALFLLLAGFLLWAGRGVVAFWEFEMLKWALVLMAGFGLEGLRREFWAASWAGQSLWFALGAALGYGLV